MKGQGSLLNVMVVVILIGLFLTFLHYTRVTGRSQRYSSISISRMASESRDVLSGTYELDYPVPMQENEELIIALRNGCAYGREKSRYTISSFVPVIYSPKEIMRSHLKRRLGENFYLAVNCTNGTLQIGSPPPEDSPFILSNDIFVPDPRGGMTEIKLMRWLE